MSISSTIIAILEQAFGRDDFQSALTERRSSTLEHLVKYYAFDKSDSHNKWAGTLRTTLLKISSKHKGFRKTREKIAEWLWFENDWTSEDVANEISEALSSAEFRDLTRSHLNPDQIRRLCDLVIPKLVDISYDRQPTTAEITKTLDSVR